MTRTSLIAGIDEVGRGPWAGPVVACALVLYREIDGLADSKTLKAERRRALFEQLRDPRVACFEIGVASVREIDQLNIRIATFLAMRRAVTRLPVRPLRLLVDGRDAPDLGLPCAGIIGGDGKVAAIAAASIVAKVWRDRLMGLLHRRHPVFGWSTNMGYGTPGHRLALAKHGVTLHHRRSFAPIRVLLSRTDGP